ncbi:MAG: NeuD/PglB/VioB family sugar acetyltransferase [Bacteroidetes bacterium]|nr:NeuD/PglB/VioB family sugar acetyltransferase [Bacteroidota bacterium]
MSKKLCIAGTGGFARETLCCYLDSISIKSDKRYELVCFMESDEYYSETHILGFPVIHQSDFDPSVYDVVVGVGDPKVRKKVVNSLPPQTTFRSVIHPSAVISEWVELGKGAVVTAGVILTCNIKVGDHAHFNLHTTVGHDCIIGDYFTTAPGVNISGNCKFGDNIYIGTNASIKQGITICSDVVVGMGGTVVKNILEAGTYIGTPVSKLSK